MGIKKLTSLSGTIGEYLRIYWPEKTIAHETLKIEKLGRKTVEASSSLQLHYDDHGDDFLLHLISTDETWRHHYIIKSNC